jgi:hypothetical protein
VQSLYRILLRRLADCGGPCRAIGPAVTRLSSPPGPTWDTPYACACSIGSGAIRTSNPPQQQGRRVTEFLIAPPGTPPRADIGRSERGEQGSKASLLLAAVDRVWGVSTPAAANTASNVAVNLASRSYQKPEPIGSVVEVHQ